VSFDFSFFLSPIISDVENLARGYIKLCQNRSSVWSQGTQDTHFSEVLAVLCLTLLFLTLLMSLLPDDEKALI